MTSKYMYIIWMVCIALFTILLNVLLKHKISVIWDMLYSIFKFELVPPHRPLSHVLNG